MSSYVSPQPGVFIPASFGSVRSRSMGAKFFLVVLLALGMSLSGFLVQGLVSERAEQRGVAAA